MIIDCHTHLGRNHHVDHSVEQLLSDMDDARIDRSLVFACDFNDCPNDYLLSQVGTHRDRLLPVLAYHPTTNLLNLVRILQSENVTAVKVYLGYDHWYPSDLQIYNLAHIASDLQIPLIFHCGDCLSSVKSAKLKYAHPLGIDELAVDFPNLKIVIAHMGFPWVRDTAEVVYKNANVYTDLSGFVYGSFSAKDGDKFAKVLEEYLDIAGDDGKLLFGSDTPISSPRSYVAETKYRGILSNDIYDKNPRKVFRL